MPDEISNFPTLEARYTTAQNPEFWYSKASDLAGAAKLLIRAQERTAAEWLQAKEVAEATARELPVGASVDIEAPSPNYLAPMMLYGFALENILKGIIVKNDPSKISANNLHADLRCHDLATLMDRAGMVFEQSERRILDVLSEITVWAGRYPTATTASFQEKVFPLGIPTDETLSWDEDHDAVFSLYDRLQRGFVELAPELNERTIYGAVVNVPQDEGAVLGYLQGVKTPAP